MFELLSEGEQELCWRASYCPDDCIGSRGYDEHCISVTQRRKDAQALLRLPRTFRPDGLVVELEIPIAEWKELGRIAGGKE